MKVKEERKVTSVSMNCILLRQRHTHRAKPQHGNGQCVSQTSINLCWCVDYWRTDGRTFHQLRIRHPQTPTYSTGLAISWERVDETMMVRITMCFNNSMVVSYSIQPVFSGEMYLSPMYEAFFPDGFFFTASCEHKNVLKTQFSPHFSPPGRK